MSQAFERSIVEVEMSQLDVIFTYARRINSETVVVRCDFDLPGSDILHRLVPASMPELQFECGASKGASDKLVTQTNSKYRYLFGKLFYFFDNSGDCCGIARTV